MPQERAQNRQMLSHHTASYMHCTKFKQLFHSGSQFSIAYSSEVIEGEEVKVLGQVTWQAVKLVQYPVGNTYVVTFFIPVSVILQRFQNTNKNTSYSLAKRQVLKRFFM